MLTNPTQSAELLKSYRYWIKLSILFICLASASGIIAFLVDIFNIRTFPGWISDAFEILGPVLLGIGCLIVILIVVFFCKTLYNIWSVIQDDGKARTQPNLAVGLLFVPVFNFYWNFVALFGLSQDLNKYIVNNNISTTLRAKEGMALTWFILGCLCAIPVVNYVIWIAVVPVAYMSLTNMKKVAVEICENKGVSR